MGRTETVRYPKSVRFAARLAAAALALAPFAVLDAPPPLASPAVENDVVWRDSDGNPLPFQDLASIEQLLREWEIVENSRIPDGVTGPRKLLLERDGVRVNAAFRTPDQTVTRHRLPDGTFFQQLRDYYGFEFAAYEVSRLLAMNSVPPTVERTINRESGTVQIWVEDTMWESERQERGFSSPDPISWRRQLQEMLLFDDLIGNIDRHSRNMLIDGEWMLWLIDHSRAFQQDDEIKNAGKVMWVRRAFWEGLQALDRDALKTAVGDHVQSRELGRMVTRHNLLVEYIQGLIDERGAEAVLYD